ncbi:MAG: AI-2E family transporter [Bacteroidales bacterium]|jgi:predicted PurR-regulated permease PerM|nr:AI-2E family transporter [Bacteroidales bacterium]
MEPHSQLLKNTARMVLAGLIIAIMVIGKSFLVPFAWSLLIALASIGLVEKAKAKTRLPMGAIIGMYLLFILLVLFAVGYFFFIELSHIFNDLPAILASLSDRLHSLSLKLADIGVHIPDHIDKKYFSDWVESHNDIIMKIISAFGLNLWDIILILFYLFFLLYYRDLLKEFFSRRIKDKRKLISVRSRIQKSLSLVRSYLYGLLLLTLISAVMNYIVFLIFGLHFGLFFAVFLAILNLIPFVGNPIGLAVIMLFAFITKDNFMVPLYIFIALFVVNFLQDNVIRPLILGDKLKINAFIVFIAIIIGGMIWGVSGMILFIPLVGIIRIFMEDNETASHYTILFSDLPKKSRQSVEIAEDTPVE